MKRSIFAAIIGGVGLVIGVVMGAGGVLVKLPPKDVMARAKAFEPEQRDWFFQHASEVFPTRTVSRGPGEELPRRAGWFDGFTFEFDGRTRALDDLFIDMETSGLIILHDGAIVYEAYDRGASDTTRFTTWSLVKSITSTLIGFAVGDGFIASVDDPLETYLPEVIGTAYEGVSVKQALEMSSGVEFDIELWSGKMEDTIDLISNGVVLKKTPTFDIAISYPRRAEPGTTFNYNTGESQVLLELVRRVTQKDAARYLEEKIWRPLGMSHDAGWIIDLAGKEGTEIGGAMFNAVLRDWARLGLFVAQGGKWNGEQLLPENWVDLATVSREPQLMHGKVHPSSTRGYGWHWWTFPDGTFTASGAHGQNIMIDRKNNIVLARASAWEKGYDVTYANEVRALFEALGEWAQLKKEAGAQGRAQQEKSDERTEEAASREG